MAKCGKKAKRAAKRAKARMLLERWHQIWNFGCDRCERGEAKSDGRLVGRHCGGCNRELALIALAAKLPKILERRAT